MLGCASVSISLCLDVSLSRYLSVFIAFFDLFHCLCLSALLSLFSNPFLSLCFLVSCVCFYLSLSFYLFLCLCMSLFKKSGSQKMSFCPHVAPYWDSSAPYWDSSAPYWDSSILISGSFTVKPFDKINQIGRDYIG